MSNNESSSGPSDVSGDTTRAARKKVRANEPLMVLDERPGENLFVNEQKPTSGTPTPTVQKPKLTDSGGIFQRLVKFGASPSVDRTVPGVSESLMNGRLNREEAYRIAEEILSTMQTKKGAPQEKLVNALMDLDIKTIFKFNNVPSAHAHSFSEALQYMRDAKDKSAGAERLTWMQRIIKIKDLMEKLRSRGISVE